MAKKKAETKSLEDLVAEHKSDAEQLQALKDERHALMRKHAAVFDKKRELEDQIDVLATKVSGSRDEINARLEAAKV